MFTHLLTHRLSRLALTIILPSALALLLMWLPGGVPTAQAATRCVNHTGAGGCYTTIHGAVSAAVAGDVISISAGTYHENLTVNKSLDFIGAGTGNTIVDGRNLNHVFTITAARAWSSSTPWTKPPAWTAAAAWKTPSRKSCTSSGSTCPPGCASSSPAAPKPSYRRNCST